ncbi:hypothetical protein Tco_1049691 [Tanacetum coccineum]
MDVLELGVSLSKALSNMTDSYYVSQGMRSYRKAPKSDMVRAQKLSDTCDLLQYALGVLHVVTLVTDGRKLVVRATVLSCSGIAVILDATHGAGYVDPEKPNSLGLKGWTLSWTLDMEW